MSTSDSEPPSSSTSSLSSPTSSFFFSSTQPSPGIHTPDDALVVPELSLPTQLPQPTAVGHTLGDLRLIVLGRPGVLFDHNPALVDTGAWEDTAAGSIRRASTSWTSSLKPSRNIHVFQPNHSRDVDALQSIIEAPFRQLSRVIHPDSRPDPLLAALLASPSSPLFTALLVLPPSEDDLDSNAEAETNNSLHTLISTFAPQIPTIVFPPPRRGNAPFDFNHASHLSEFAPSSLAALLHGLFESPDTLTLLRAEAADRFMHWREVDRSARLIGNVVGSNVQDVVSQRRKRRRVAPWQAGTDSGEERDDLNDVYGYQRRVVVVLGERWDKARWEREWMENHSYHVSVKRSREGTITQPRQPRRLGLLMPDDESSSSSLPLPAPAPCASVSFDPLHFPSLFLFSVSLLTPLRLRIQQTLKDLYDAVQGRGRNAHIVQVALVGGFCVGFGIGLYVRR